MKKTMIRAAVCPKCGKEYRAAPALSRTDNRTYICPDCGTREALESLGIDAREREKIIGIIHANSAHGIRE